MSQPQPRRTVNAPAVQGKPAATRTTPQVASTQTTTAKFTPDTTHKLYRLNLPRDIQYLRSITETFAAPDGTAICGPYVPKNDLPEISFPFLPRARVTDAGAANSGNAAPGPQPNPNNVLLVIPTSNESKTKMLLDHLHKIKPPHIKLTHRQIPAKSGVGEQPYDGAGPLGAFTRVLNAIRTLQADPQRRKALLDKRIGTIIVGAIENFMQRPSGPGGRAVDYGVVVFCVVSLMPGADQSGGKWKWSMGVSGGVSAPTEYWKEAETFGFEKNVREHGNVTIGELLHVNAGLDKANWHLQLAGVSRYDLLEDAMKALKVPWPEERRAVAVAGDGAQRRGGGTNGTAVRANGASVRANGAAVRASPEATGRPKQTTQQS
ncbi:uncharacterized protein C8A04DRAFT_27869 [Dichotomopilus funicola]|uniref:Uncharacterized protein n=1 Tax=Dichotomopilus funicola TaxID=1934379 RepID=A0AAN6ZMZ7_9PEZI|nr:hypothetical protein C8A04DRAFT_27869 [Dichotomopilus funicola]